MCCDHSFYAKIFEEFNVGLRGVAKGGANHYLREINVTEKQDDISSVTVHRPTESGAPRR